MIVNRNKLQFGLTDLLLAAASVLYLLGIRLWFPVCEAMGDMVMTCHWAGEVLKALSVLVCALALLHIFLPRALGKVGMDLSLIGVGVLTVFVPGRIISLCANAEMACRSMAHPWTVVFSAALILLSLADVAFCLSRESKDKHKRS